MEGACAAALEWAMEDAAAADDSQAGGVTVLTAGEEVPVVLGAVSAQVAAGDAFLSVTAFLQGPEPWGREGWLLALKLPRAALALSSALPFILILLPSPLSPAIAGSQKNS